MPRRMRESFYARRVDDKPFPEIAREQAVTLSALEKQVKLGTDWLVGEIGAWEPVPRSTGCWTRPLR